MNLAQLSLSGPELGFRDAKRWEDLDKISVGRGQWKVQRLGGGISAVRWAGGAKHSAGLELKIHAERRSGNCSAPFRWHSPLKTYRWEYSRRKNNLVSLRKSLLRRKQARNSR